MTELESTRELTRADVADYLREFAAQLDASTAVPDPIPERDREDDDGRVTFVVGDDSATINPPDRVTFDVEVESDPSLVGSEVEHEVTFGLSWQTEATDEGEGNLEIR